MSFVEPLPADPNDDRLSTGEVFSLASLTTAYSSSMVVATLLVIRLSNSSFGRNGIVEDLLSLLFFLPFVLVAGFLFCMFTLMPLWFAIGWLANRFRRIGQGACVLIGLVAWFLFARWFSGDGGPDPVWLDSVRTNFIVLTMAAGGLAGWLAHRTVYPAKSWFDD